MTLKFVAALLGTWVKERPGIKQPRLLYQHETGGNYGRTLEKLEDDIDI